MKLDDVLDAIEARSTYRFGFGNPREATGHTLSKELARLSGRIINNEATGRPVGYDGRIEYGPQEAERALLHLRMNDVGGVLTGPTSQLRRTAQAVIPKEHRPGWICMSRGRAWFQSEPPVDLVTAGEGVMAIRVHSDCAC